MSLFRYGLDYVQLAIQRLIGFGKKEEFKEILAILRKQNHDRIRVLWNLSCTEKVVNQSANWLQIAMYLFDKFGKMAAIDLNILIN